jgi:uncharacterized membrane protein
MARIGDRLLDKLSAIAGSWAFITFFVGMILRLTKF